MEGSEKRLFILEGACSTGKSALLHLYEDEQHPALRLVPEAARLFYSTHTIPVENRYTFQTQRRIQLAGIANIANAIAEGYPIVLADTSPMAAVAYATLSNPENARKLLACVSRWCQQVSMFLITDPKDIDYHFDPQDSVRKETPEQRMAVHQALIKLLSETGVPLSSVSGSVEERKKFVDSLLLKLPRPYGRGFLKYTSSGAEILPKRKTCSASHDLTIGDFREGGLKEG